MLLSYAGMMPNCEKLGSTSMSVEYKDYYKILGVDKKAPKEEISKAFKKLARKYHPDLNPDDKVAESKFKEINEAHEVLKDPEKRKMYDQLGPNWQHGQQFQGASGFGRGAYNQAGFDFGGGAFSDFFESLFGNGGMNFGQQRASHGFGDFGAHSHQSRGNDVETELKLSLEDVLKGGEKKFTVKINGAIKTLQVNVPAGVKEGAKLRLSGQGEAGMGGVAGDLYLKIAYIKHDLFEVDGNNITYNLKLMPWQAVLGAKLRIPTLENEVELNIKADTHAGNKLRLSGKGLGAPNKRGDLYIHIGIDTPSEINEEQLELWKKLEELNSN